MTARSSRLAKPGHTPRQHRRYANTGVEFRSGLVEACLVDLSDQGAGIAASSAPRIGAPVSFELENGQTVTRLEGEVRWCTLTRTRNDNGKGDVLPVFRAGIRLTNGSSRDVRCILDDLERADPAAEG